MGGIENNPPATNKSNGVAKLIEKHCIRVETRCY
jgi:hypothetical protein